MYQIPKLSLKTDSFLHACSQAFEARSQSSTAFNSHLRFEPFLLETFSMPENPSLKSFQETVQAIFKHHQQAWPQLRKEADITSETLAYFSHAVAAILGDYQSLLFYYTGSTLPLIPTQTVDYKPTYPVLSAAIKKLTTLKPEERPPAKRYDPFPIEDLTSEVPAEEQLHVFSCEVWDLFSLELRKTMAPYADAILVYVSWKYQSKSQQQVEPIDWRVRPPCGEAYAKAFERFEPRRGGAEFRPRGGSNFAGRQERGPRPDFRGEKGGRPERHERFERNERPDRGERVERTDTRPAPARHERREERQDSRRDARQHHGERPRRSENTPDATTLDQLREKATESQQLEAFEKCLAEIDAAAEKLTQNPKLRELPLSPQNPFLRRAQHMYAAELGLVSESRGEGPARCIFVKKKTA